MTTRSKSKKKAEIEEEENGASREIQINGKTGTTSDEVSKKFVHVIICFNLKAPGF